MIGTEITGKLFVATERNAKLRYEGYKKLSEINILQPKLSSPRGIPSF